LYAVAQRRSLFDDPAEEINEMTAIIKQSITHLSTEVTDLKVRASTDGGTNKQSKQHSTGVINSLQQTLKTTTSEFMNVVKTRRQTVQDQEERKSMYGASSAPLRSNIFTTGPPGGGAAGGAAGGGGGGAGATEREGPSYSSGGLGDSFESQAQLVAMAPQDYLQNRADDVEQVESTIRELGGIFGKLAEIVSEQGEMVERCVPPPPPPGRLPDLMADRPTHATDWLTHANTNTTYTNPRSDFRVSYLNACAVLCCAVLCVHKCTGSTRTWRRWTAMCRVHRLSSSNTSTQSRAIAH
jgi:uncharacterized protein YaiE (UPF0345 family)